jgi:uncharacterized protein YjbJ (UPF0337 family)
MGGTIMNADIFKGKWHEMKGAVKAKWGKLTDDDLTTIDGRTEELVGMIQRRYGYARDQAKSEVDHFLSMHERDAMHEREA